MKRARQIKFGTFKCKCGCNQEFTANYVTRAPQYVDKSHRNRKLASNKAVAREAKSKELFRLYKERRAKFTKLGIKGPMASRLAKAINDKEFLPLVLKLQAARLKEEASE